MNVIPCSVVFTVPVAIHAVVLVVVTVSINCHLKTSEIFILFEPKLPLSADNRIGFDLYLAAGLYV